ncbi:hypothetical protein BDN72DRAFT_10560 [Pluteus cervinus]|uniref:Uncharacterized protein n=1 Tax=Pluteus cervinus TaxID=181527 RepID=A0ACD3BIC2_9AGAR|nr:hypothetical protein BDN72DRAFT_10560 [Pluteus cervinus]
MLANLLVRSHLPCIQISYGPVHNLCIQINRTGIRTYATHRDANSPSLSQSLDTRQHAYQHADNVGPFQLGVSQSSLRNNEKVPKWSELSTSGKVMRSTARTTNLGVILLGAGLSALLVYSLTSELFSKNSPTVLYGDACERIKSSQKVSKYLNGPLAFHNNPPSVIRPRHRNRHVTSQIFLDTHGNEHMVLTFYVKGAPPGSTPSSDESYLECLSTWTQDIVASLSELTLDESVEWTKQYTYEIWDKTKNAFRYVSGTPSLPSEKYPFEGEQESTKAQKKKAPEGSAWSFAGMFGSLRGGKSSGLSEVGHKEDGRVFTDGEVHADLIRNEDGYFVFRYLLIDIPSSRHHNPIRVFVERTPGVRDSEPVMRWNS